MTRDEWLDPKRRWQHFGGTGVVLVALLGTVRSAIDAIVAGNGAGFLPTASIAIHWLAALVGVVAAAFLAFGSTGTNGIVGGSLVGRASILLWGAHSVVGLAIGEADRPASAVEAVWYVAGGVAIFAIARAGVAVGIARLVAVLAVAAAVLMTVIGVIVVDETGLSVDAIGPYLLVAASVLEAWVGITWLRNRPV